MAPLLRVFITGPSANDLQPVAVAVEQSSDLALVGITSLDQAEASCRRLQPDAVLMTYARRASEALAIITRISADTRVLLFGGIQDAEAADGLLAGADGVLGREVSADEIVAMILTDTREGVSCPDCVTYELFNRLYQLKSSRTSDLCLVQTDLSFQEVTILRLLGAGLSNKQIAQYNNLSVHTVKNYVHRILKRLRLQNRFQAADYFHTVAGGVVAGDSGPSGWTLVGSMRQV